MKLRFTLRKLAAERVGLLNGILNWIGNAMGNENILIEYISKMKMLHSNKCLTHLRRKTQLNGPRFFSTWSSHLATSLLEPEKLLFADNNDNYYPSNICDNRPSIHILKSLVFIGFHKVFVRHSNLRVLVYATGKLSSFGHEGVGQRETDI